MEVRINKEVRGYTESIFLGLSARQFIFSLIACAVALIIYFSFIDKLGSEVTSWLCIIGVIPFAAFGFVTFQQMYMEDIIKHFLYSLMIQRTDLIDVPFNLYNLMFKDYLKRKRKELLKKHDQKLSEIKETKQGKV